MEQKREFIQMELQMEQKRGFHFKIFQRNKKLLAQFFLKLGYLYKKNVNQKIF